MCMDKHCLSKISSATFLLSVAVFLVNVILQVYLSYVCRNIVCTVNLGCKLDLKKIALHARNAEYNPKRFAAVIMRIREPRTTALIFSSGKMVCTGAKRFVHCSYESCSCWTVLYFYCAHEWSLQVFTGMTIMWLRAGCRNARLTARLGNRELTVTARLTCGRVARRTVSKP